ncbi:MAG: hypothetical protein QFX35_06550, partial [Candidatus Verstraetearchaeota archaeon]|nr:hypothetical protein [Candidatus Verstraetearchaeota archaeon]
VTSLEERIRLKSAQLEDIKGAIVQRKKEAEALWLDYLTEKERLRELFSSQALRERAASGDRLDSLVKSYVAVMVDEAVMRYREGELEQELRDLYSDLEEAKRLLEDSRVSAVGAGDRIQTSRTILEISEEIRFVNAHLLSLGEVPEDAPSMYQAYQKTYQELKQKASVVGENRKHLIEEIAERKRVWKEILEKLILEINPVYRSVLSKVGGTGDVRLSNMDDPEKAGLEVTVGFRGASPVLLDAYAQSGGERAVATMAFLLALQHQLKSPVRAVDEFDVHMDPFNREAMMRMLFAFMRENSDVQFIVITPSQLSAVGEFANIIFVQNVHGRSEVARAAAPST